MNEATQWLHSRPRNYQEGLKIYNRYKISNKHDAFFASVINPEQNSIQMQILITQMVKIERKIDNTPLGKETRKPIEVIPIKVETNTARHDISRPPDISAMRENKLLVNKLLSMVWENLSIEDRAIFFDNKEYYSSKQEVLHEISTLKNEMHAADAKRKSAKNTKDRKKFNDMVSEIEGRIKNLFKKKIDNWEIPVKELGTDAAAEAIRRERRIRYLEGTALPRAKKELKAGKLTSEQKELRRNNISEWKTELAELKKIHNL